MTKTNKHAIYKKENAKYKNISPAYGSSVKIKKLVEKEESKTSMSKRTLKTMEKNPKRSSSSIIIKKYSR